HLRRRGRRDDPRHDPLVLGRLLRLGVDRRGDLRDPDPRPGVPPDGPVRHAGAGKVRTLRAIWETDPRKDPTAAAFIALGIAARAGPGLLGLFTSNSGFWFSVLGDAGVYMLLALGLNVVVGFAGLLDLGYAAFFAIGAYTYAMIASEHGVVTPLHQAIHLPF